MASFETITLKSTLRHNSQINLPLSWKNSLQSEFEKDYMLSLKKFLLEEYKKKKAIYPPAQKIFEGFNLTSLENVKIVILGQDPYHGPGQAHGLCFSVQEGVEIPPSLQNIYKELKTDIGFKFPKSGDLTNWAKQGVLLLNTTLTVEKSKPLSHQGKGWEIFTDEVIKVLNSDKNPKVFLLWGNHAISKQELITNKIHLIIKAPHPSPLSAHRGFLGCKHFSKANDFLKQNHIGPINWNLN